MILEVLIALLIFSLGVLGLVGLQASATKSSGQAQFRAQAVLLADELVGMMWAGDRTNANLLNVYGPGSTDAGFTTWKNKVATTLPGAALPTVTLTTVDPLPVVPGPAGSQTPSTPLPSTQVAITVSWQAAGESSSDNLHNVTVFTQIK